MSASLRRRSGAAHPSRFFGMDETTTVKTWTVMETTLGLVVFAIAAVLWLVL
ncbi:MAG: hypothetical protein ABR500_09555 [Dermatophilaceae bacterium]|nr:hypothetical protein [Intrasporangiaceae bacterium]